MAVKLKILYQSTPIGSGKAGPAIQQFEDTVNAFLAPLQPAKVRTPIDVIIRQSLSGQQASFFAFIFYEA